LEIKSAEFVISNTDVAKCPAPTLPEYAFIGRSNVGKSSLINMLVVRKDLAKTSSKPGKTQLINHFLINENWYLVDLPGYGYAQVSREKREKWELFIRKYILTRLNLMCIMVLIDSRLPAQRVDLEFMEWLGEKEVPFAIVFTKTDKLTKQQLKENIELYKQTLLKTWVELPQLFLTSAEKRLGREELLQFIDESNSLFKA
jgi:GTP-binding protein